MRSTTPEGSAMQDHSPEADLRPERRDRSRPSPPALQPPRAPLLRPLPSRPLPPGHQFHASTPSLAVGSASAGCLLHQLPTDQSPWSSIPHPLAFSPSTPTHRSRSPPTPDPPESFTIDSPTGVPHHRLPRQPASPFATRSSVTRAPAGSPIYTSGPWLKPSAAGPSTTRPKSSSGTSAIGIVVCRAPTM